LDRKQQKIYQMNTIPEVKYNHIKGIWWTIVKRVEGVDQVMISITNFNTCTIFLNKTILGMNENDSK